MVWKKGQSGNPAGRPIAAISRELIEALKSQEIEQKKSFIAHLVEQAYKDNTVAIALAKKILPDLQHNSNENLNVTIMRVIRKNGDKVDFNIGS